MRRKMLGAILLPIPFAALPVVVVLAGALFGSHSTNGELLTREQLGPSAEQRVSSDIIIDGADSTLAKVTADSQPSGCDFDIQGET
ncbi:MAG: hypothetical protein ABI577_07785 [bacterium]